MVCCGQLVSGGARAKQVGDDFGKKGTTTALLHKTGKTKPNDTTVVCGDFNAPHKELGYSRTSVKGRELLEEASNAGFVLFTDLDTPTRIGTSTTRDTNPDLTFARLSGKARGTATWHNTGHNLGSDHYIIELNVPTTVHNDHRKFKLKLTDWTRFRATLDELDHKIDDIEAWTGRIASAADSVTAELEVEENVKQVDSKLAHMIEAKQSLQRRWKRQRHNRRLRKRVAELGRATEKYSRELCSQQWYATCSAADGQLHKGQTWKLLRHLLHDKSTRGHQQHKLAQTIYTAVKELGEEEASKRINAKYLPVEASETHTEHSGPDNPELDREIEEWEVRAVLQELNCKSAAGPDRLHNRALRNLNDGAIAALTRYFNKCWREGKLPKQWKTARTVIIPKPGKPPNIENLRPISLTSCVGKVMEHVMRNRWSRYLEEKGLYPDAMIGFREKLSTQDAMIQLQHEILNVSVPTNDNRAVLGLDLQSAFDKVRHSAILSQASRLGLGRRSFNYIWDYLSNRTRLNAQVPQVRYTIYADDITLWVPGGSNGHIEETLQEAVNAIEDQLDGTGLRCSPQKSELLIVPPPGRYRRKATEDSERIVLRTRDGTVIPKVSRLRVLGIVLEASRSNGATVDKLVTKMGTATRLIKRVATRHRGMKEASLLRLVQSFAVSHVAYVGAFHYWKVQERDRINAAIRKTYKAALGRYNCASTAKLLELGVHNTLEEIAEAQRTSQRERLLTTQTGRSILAKLGLGASTASNDERDGGALPEGALRRLVVAPLPRNVHPEHNRGRREARAKALIETHATDTGALYVDAAKYKDREDTYVAVVVRATTGEVYSACSVRVQRAHQAEAWRNFLHERRRQP
ncbi:uncharacterized protein LOC144179700 [Haemaphysalis longicornis]